jgi:hypothetical protein
MSIPRPQQWTEAEVHRLRMLAKRKVSADCIAKSLGRYVGSVKNKSTRIESDPLQEPEGDEMIATSHGRRSWKDSPTAKAIAATISLLLIADLIAVLAFALLSMQ